jgi:hypothetical protein
MNESPTRFPYRIERWEKDAVHHVAGVEDFLLAHATYQAACRRWPDARITCAGVANSSQTAATIRLYDSDDLAWEPGSPHRVDESGFDFVI